MGRQRQRRNPEEDERGWRRFLPGAFAAGLVGLGALGAVTYGPTFVATLKELQLEPETRERYLQLKSILAGRGISLYTGSTRRTPAEQQKALDSGNSATSISWHMTGRAVDAYPIDPATGQPDLKAKRPDLFRIMHQVWASLGGQGLAYLPYPDGPNRIITGAKGRIWDGGHLEWRGQYSSAAEAYRAMIG
jgi:hypothetical protein